MNSVIKKEFVSFTSAMVVSPPKGSLVEVLVPGEKVSRAGTFGK